MPNYIRHPTLNYKVDVEKERLSSSSPTPPSATLQKPLPMGKKTRSANDLDEARSPSPQPSFRILKVRLVGREDYDRDFIEVDVPLKCLTFRKLIDVLCEEFSIDPGAIVKIRKLPDTKMRRDAEVRRLADYTELEVETTKGAAEGSSA